MTLFGLLLLSTRPVFHKLQILQAFLFLWRYLLVVWLISILFPRFISLSLSCSFCSRAIEFGRETSFDHQDNASSDTTFLDTYVWFVAGSQHFHPSICSSYPTKMHKTTSFIKLVAEMIWQEHITQPKIWKWLTVWIIFLCFSMVRWISIFPAAACWWHGQ